MGTDHRKETESPTDHTNVSEGKPLPADPSR